MSASSVGQVVLTDNQSALQVLHAALQSGVNSAPADFAGAGWAAGGESFRKHYADVVPRLEAARRASSQRQAIGRTMLDALQTRIGWQDGSGLQPLTRLLAQPVAGLPVNQHKFSAVPGWRPNLVYRGQRWDIDGFAELGSLLVERHVITPAAADALAWLGRQDTRLDLSGRRIAVLGGGAEMAPTRLWLQAGADVLWLDTNPPPAQWLQASDLAGRLVWPKDNVDLLTQPREVLATIMAFADGHAVDLGLYAYAPGQARELRLTMSMNAIVSALPADLVATVTMLVSPTTATSLSTQDTALTRQRRSHRPGWEAACAAVGLLGRGEGYVTSGEAAVSRSIVSIQGASYQAAQYLGKVLTAECWHHFDHLRVSANSAAITRTRSLDHPVFAAAFGGAAAFGVETLTPRQSRRLNGLLAVHDWLHPDLPEPGNIRVHGGIHTLPYPLGSALRVAAAIGFARAPRLLGGLLRPAKTRPAKLR